jgi:prolipoprotein diacylglyceryltransferase
MLKRFNTRQKSPKRRFLLILGAVAFICIFILGFMIMFWDKLNLNLSQQQRYLFGAFFIIYAILRFTRLFKREPDEE